MEQPSTSAPRGSTQRKGQALAGSLLSHSFHPKKTCTRLDLAFQQHRALLFCFSAGDLLPKEHPGEVTAPGPQLRQQKAVGCSIPPLRTPQGSDRLQQPRKPFLPLPPDSPPLLSPPKMVAASNSRESNIQAGKITCYFPSGDVRACHARRLGSGAGRARLDVPTRPPAGLAVPPGLQKAPSPRGAALPSLPATGWGCPGWGHRPVGTSRTGSILILGTSQVLARGEIAFFFFFLFGAI